jgi:DNA-binding NarL/FixJ family response regulator
VVTETLLRVVIVEDVDEMRAVIRLNLELMGDFQIVGEAADAATGIPEVADTQPDVVVLDLGLPDAFGGDIIGDLRQVCPGCKIVVLTALDEEHTGRVRGLGVEAVISKKAGFIARTADAIRAACEVPRQDA